MNTILSFTGTSFDTLISWARYLYWSELHRRRHDSWLEKHPPKDSDGIDWQFIALMSAFYSSVWVVIEGWQVIPLKDETIDRILKASPKYLQLLKRFRNSVFHYQSSIVDDRFVQFLGQGQAAMLWVYFVHGEFKRYLWELLRNVNVSENMRRKLRMSVKNIIGWVPVDVVEYHAHSLRQRSEKAIRMLEKAGDLSSPAAVDLLSASYNALSVAEEDEKKYTDWKSELIKDIEKSNRSE